MSALHISLEIEFRERSGWSCVGWDTFSIGLSASRNNHTPFNFRTMVLSVRLILSGGRNLAPNLCDLRNNDNIYLLDALSKA